MLSSRNKLQITTNAMLRISNISVNTYENEEKVISTKHCSKIRKAKIFAVLVESTV